jgi:ABC-type phosphate transport system substrate-binding protein
MKMLSRGVGLFLLFALLPTATALFAQDNDTISVGGSGIVLPLIEDLTQANENIEDISVSITGTTAGITSFCEGELDMVVTNRPLSVDEDTACLANNVNYIEQLISHDVIAFIANPDSEMPACLTLADLDTIFAPSTEGEIKDWATVNADSSDIPLTVILPATDTSMYALLDKTIVGDGIRGDGEIQESASDLIASVSETPGAIGAINLAEAVAAGDSVKILELDSTDIGGCAPPSAENVEKRLYSAANRLFLYINETSLDKPDLQALLTSLNSEDAAVLIEAVGFTPPSATAYQMNLAGLETEQVGRQFSQDVVSFEIPETLSGAITIGGAAHAHDYLQSVTNTFNGVYPGVTVTYQVEGEPAGLRRLCNGEIDIAVTYGDMSPEQMVNCEANNIETYAIKLGVQAVVTLANANPELPACLTTDQLETIWGADSADTVQQWNHIDSSMPENALILFAPRAGDPYTDLLLTQASNKPIPSRQDIEINTDPLYRAAATANVEGGLTYMSWQDYQRALANNQANIKLLAIEGDADCVLPTQETIANVTYPLTRQAHLVVSQPSLAREEVHALLWYLLDDQTYGLLENADLIGVSFADLPALRENLERTFIQAQSTAMEIVPEVTPEPDSE